MPDDAHLFFGYHKRDLFFALNLACLLKETGVPLIMDRLDAHNRLNTSDVLAAKHDGYTAGLIILVSKQNISTETLRQTVMEYKRNSISVSLLVTPEVNQWVDELNQYNTDPIFISRQVMTKTDERYAHVVQICDALLDRFPRIRLKPPSTDERYLYRLMTHMELQHGLMEDLTWENRAKEGVSSPQTIEHWHDPARFQLYTPAREPIKGYSRFGDILEDHLRFFLIGNAGSGKSTLVRQNILQQAHHYLAELASDKSPPFPVYVKVANWQPLSPQLTAHENAVSFETVLDSQIASLEESLPQVKTMLADGRAMLWIELLTDSPLAFEAVKAWIQHGDIPHRMVISVDNAFSEALMTGLELPIVEIERMHHQHVHQFASHYFGENGDFLLDTFIYRENAIADDGTVRTMSHLGQLGMMLHQYLASDDITTPQTISQAVQGFVRYRWETYYVPEAESASQGAAYEDLLLTLSRLAKLMLFNGWIGFIPHEIMEKKLARDHAFQIAHDIGLLYSTSEGVGFVFSEMLYYFAGRELSTQIISKILKPPQFTSRGQLVLTAWDRAIVYLLDIGTDFENVVSVVSEINPYLVLSAADKLAGDYALFAFVLSRLIAMEKTPSPAALECLAFFPPDVMNAFLLKMAREENWNTRVKVVQILTALADDEFPGFDDVLAVGLNEQVVAALKLLQEDIVPVLMSLMNQPEHRFIAVNALGKLGDKAAVPAIVEQMRVSGGRDRAAWLSACITALGQLGDEDTLDMLVPYLQDDDETIQRAVVQAMVAHGQPALLRLQTLAQHEDANIRYLAVMGLNRFAEPSAIKARIDAVDDADPDVQMLAVQGLAEVQQMDVLTALLKRVMIKEALHATKSQGTVQNAARDVLIEMGVAASDLNLRKLNDARIQQIAKRTFDSYQVKALRKSASLAKERLARVSRKVDGDAGSGGRGSTLSEEDVDTLLLHLNSSNTQHRLDALSKISEAINAAVINKVIDCIHDPNRLVSELAVNVMQRIGREILPQLQQMLTDSDLNTRCVALAIVTELPDERLIPSLADCLSVTDFCSVGHINGRISDLAAKCLLSIGTEKSLDVLANWRKQAFIDHASQHHVEGQVQLPGVPVISTQPMSLINYQETFASLLTQVRLAPWDSKHIAARALHAQAKALQKKAPQEVIDLLVDVLSDPDWVMRWVACEALAWLADKRVVPALKQCVQDAHWNIRLTAIGGLLEINDIALVNVIEPSLKDDNSQVRELAAEAVGKLGGVKQVPALIDVARNDSDDLVRFAAIVALGSIPDAKSVEVLLELMRNDDIGLKWAAARSLSRIANRSDVESLIPYLEDVSRPDWDNNRVCDWIEEALERIATPEARYALKQWRFSMH